MKLLYSYKIALSMTLKYGSLECISWVNWERKGKCMKAVYFPTSILCVPDSVIVFYGFPFITCYFLWQQPPKRLPLIPNSFHSHPPFPSFHKSSRFGLCEYGRSHGKSLQRLGYKNLRFLSFHLGFSHLYSFENDHMVKNKQTKTLRYTAYR